MPIPRIHNPRTSAVEVDSIFTDRWSPRAMRPDPLREEEVAALFEAARWAPSCSNEQPWLFLYATDEKERQRFASALVGKNQRWAARAPLLIYLLGRRRFARNGAANRHALFDCGAAWLALALQARRLGLYAHAMAGFDAAAARTVLAVPEEYEIIAAIAVGRHGDPAALPEDLAAIEQPNDRRPHAEIARCGGFA